LAASYGVSIGFPLDNACESEPGGREGQRRLGLGLPGWEMGRRTGRPRRGKAGAGVADETERRLAVPRHSEGANRGERFHHVPAIETGGERSRI